MQLREKKRALVMPKMGGPIDLSGRQAALSFAATLMVSLAAAGGVNGWLLHRPAFHWPELLWLFYGGYPAASAFGRGAYADGDTLSIARPFRAPVRVPWQSVVAVRSVGWGPYGWQVRAADGPYQTAFTWLPSAFARVILSSAAHADLDPYLRDLARPASPYRMDTRSRLMTIIALVGPWVVVGAAALAFR